MRTTAMFLTVVLVLAAVPMGSAVGAGAPVHDVSQDDCGFPYSDTDATGTDVTIEGEPQRVVALGPSTSQILWELDAQESVVGMPVRPYTDYLDGSENRTDVYTEDGTSVDVEKVVSLDPDLVLAPSIIANDTVTQLRDAGVTVYRFQFDRSIEGIYAKTELVGRLVGACGNANTTVSEMRSSVERVEGAVGARSPRRRVRRGQRAR